MTAGRRGVYLGRQAIVDNRQRVVAYELLFREGPQNEAHIIDHSMASAQAIQAAFRDIGVRTVLGPRVGFVNVDAAMLLNPAIEQLPGDKVVIELLETIESDKRIVARCRDLKSKGYRLALDDFSHYTNGFEPLLALVDIVKVDISILDAAALTELVTRLKAWPAKLLAEKVETIEQARQCFELGFRLFQGFLFSRPAVLCG